MHRIRRCLPILLLFSLVETSRAEPQRSDGPCVVSLRTVDGSELTGVVGPQSAVLEAGYGNVELPLSLIRTVRFDEHHTQARVGLEGGDRLSGRIKTERLKLTTAFGRLSAPWARIVELDVLPDREVPDQIACPPVTHRPIRFEVVLRDASCVMATPEGAAAAVLGELGRVEIPWALVHRVLFHDDRETATLEFYGGDKLVGCVDWRAVKLSTGLGPGRISTVDTESIHLSLGGIDLVGRRYKSVQGNEHFLNHMKYTGAKRILGRTRPGCDFLCAHAGGRIEYHFRQPIREFHAVAAMYESYCAHKGNVIFRVETDQGVVYSSPPLRNLQSRDVYLRFPPTQKLVLITDQNGSADEDWSVWLHPEVR